MEGPRLKDVALSCPRTPHRSATIPPPRPVTLPSTVHSVHTSHPPQALPTRIVHHCNLHLIVPPHTPAPTLTGDRLIPYACQLTPPTHSHPLITAGTCRPTRGAIIRAPRPAAITGVLVHIAILQHLHLLHPEAASSATKVHPVRHRHSNCNTVTGCASIVTAVWEEGIARPGLDPIHRQAGHMTMLLARLGL